MWARVQNVCLYVAAAVLMYGVVQSSSLQCSEEPIVKAQQCSYNGSLMCGECMCEPGFYGEQCECQEGPWGWDGTTGDSGCKETNKSPVCSGRGSCACGKCNCNERANPNEIVSGQFCECTNYLCPRFNGLLCGGMDHGLCDCNKCICRPGWSGEDCMCQDSNHDCIDPETGIICSGNGICECNSCKCSDTEAGRYSGKFCEDCPICKSKCVPFKACVQCQVFGTGELTRDQCYNQCTLFNATPVNKVQTTEEGDRLCTFFDENDCRFKFVYNYDKYNDPFVFVETTLECPPPHTGDNNEGLKDNGAGRNEDSLLHLLVLMSSVVCVCVCVCVARKGKVGDIHYAALCHIS